MTNFALALAAHENKIGSLLAYICFQLPQIHLRKLLKIVYLMDEKSVRERSIPLTWLDYYAWKKGPVAPDVYAVRDGALSTYVTCRKEADEKWHVTANCTNPYLIDQAMGAYSEYEMDIINSVIAQCKEKSADDLTNETHQEDSLWSRVVANNHVSFDETGRSNYKVDLNDLNDEIGREIYAEALDCVMMQASLNSLAHV